MQDDATPHKDNEAIRALRGVFGEPNGKDRFVVPLISRCKPLWFLWVKLQWVVYADNPHGLEALKCISSETAVGALGAQMFTQPVHFLAYIIRD
jgi:hypothetical protein